MISYNLTYVDDG